MQTSSLGKLAIVFVIISLSFNVASFSYEGFTFVSIADFLNNDIPPKGWRPTLDKTLGSIKAENPEFVLVPGDMVLGRWYFNQLHRKADRVYANWQKRMHQYGLKYYTAVGDHEIGDLPTSNFPIIYQLIPEYLKAYKDSFEFPKNGPEGLKELAYYFKHKNALFVTLYTFSRGSGKVRTKISQNQLNWLNEVLSKNDSDFTVVQGHVPILPVESKSRHSGGLIYENGRKSELWQLMAKQDVDLYLCGERHVLDVAWSDGITQIVHGSILGKANSVNYVLAIVSNKRLKIKLKRIEVRNRDLSWHFTFAGPFYNKIIPVGSFATVKTLTIDS
ncbi:MAG: metallophosphoesterase [Candidatus Bipolaricaulia bacterium]